MMIGGGTDTNFVIRPALNGRGDSISLQSTSDADMYVGVHDSGSVSMLSASASDADMLSFQYDETSDGRYALRSTAAAYSGRYLSKSTEASSCSFGNALHMTSVLDPEDGAWSAWC